LDRRQTVVGPHVGNDLEDALAQVEWLDAEFGAQAGIVDHVVGGTGLRALAVFE
jgi:hypothetical protein